MTIDDEELRQCVWAGILQYFEKHIYERDFLPYLQTVLDWLLTLEQAGATELNESLLNYLGAAGNIGDLHVFEAMILETLPKTGAKMTSAFQQIEERGLKKGLEQGLEQGMTESARQIAKRMLVIGATVDFIVDATGLSLATVRELQAKIKASAA